MIDFFSGLVYGNGLEWFLHKYLLHEEGKKKDNFFRFHFAEHHKEARLHDFKDKFYESSLFEWNPQSKEVVSLGLATLVHLPTAFVSPGFFLGLAFSGGYYYFVHKKSHLNPDWARENIPWHYDHHMGPDQDKNFCVTFPLFDYIMGTREYYHSTEKELEDRKRRQEKLAA